MLPHPCEQEAHIRLGENAEPSRTGAAFSGCRWIIRLPLRDGELVVESTMGKRESFDVENPKYRSARGLRKFWRCAGCQGSWVLRCGSGWLTYLTMDEDSPRSSIQNRKLY